MFAIIYAMLRVYRMGTLYHVHLMVGLLVGLTQRFENLCPYLPSSPLNTFQSKPMLEIHFKELYLMTTMAFIK